jgi:hypothetical protein
MKIRFDLHFKSDFFHRHYIIYFITNKRPLHPLLDHLQQLRDAQLIHAGPQVMSLGPQVLVHALGEPHGDDPRRLALGVGGVFLLAELHQPLLDLLEFRTLFEGIEVFEPGKLAADDAVDPQHLAKKGHPVRLSFIEVAGGLQDALILLRRFGKHGVVSLPGRAKT